MSSIICHNYTDLKTNSFHSKQYLKLELLGKGGFARCYVIKSFDTHRKYACKIIPKSKLVKKSTRLKLVTEIKIHKYVSNHKNIVNFIKWFEDDNCVYIVLEICKNKSLLSLIKSRGKFTESEVRYFMAQILSALRHLKKKNVIHRDLKLGNAFISSDYTIKLGDFGLATKLNTDCERKMTICGTPNYIAPEMLNKEKTGHSFEVDIWSLGVIMYTLLIGTPPFETSDVKTTYSKIRKNSYKFPKDIKLSVRAKGLIKKILKLDPQKRPNLTDIRLDPFFTTTLIPKNLPLAAGYTVPIIKNFKKDISSSIIIEKDIDSFKEEKEFKEKIKILKSKRNRALVERKNGVVNYNDSQLNKEIEDNVSEEKGEKDDYLVSDSEINLSNTINLINYEPSIWVSCWIDYSSKYGIGYTLSNGVHGVYFNDSSKMLLHTDKTKIEYFETSKSFIKSNKKNNSKENQMNYNCESITLDPFKYKSEYKKKVTLLKYFSEYLERKNKVEITSKNYINDLKKDPILINHWFKTSSAKIFVLNNDTIQINFKDNTEIIISFMESKKNIKKDILFYVKNGIFTVTEKDGERNNFYFRSVLKKSNKELCQKAKYCFEVIKKIM